MYNTNDNKIDLITHITNNKLQATFVIIKKDPNYVKIYT